MRPSRLGPLLLLLGLAAAGCGPGEQAVPLEVPRGYLASLRLEAEGRLLGFGPFVGYYFRPEEPADLTRLRFVCFNERQFYTRDLPANALLFEGEARLATLPELGMPLPRGEERIQPVLPGEIPPGWLATRPAPQAEFVHFHSAYDGTGPVRTGYWLRHRAVAAFAYDMGGRVGPGSVLYHRVEPGVDLGFPPLVEFDRGPAREAAAGQAAAGRPQ